MLGFKHCQQTPPDPFHRSHPSVRFILGLYQVVRWAAAVQAEVTASGQQVRDQAPPWLTRSSSVHGGLLG